MNMMNRNGTLGLALAGGGARGAAHVGVLLELERLGVEPDLITGTSIGGVIGALVASGLDVDDVSDFLEQLKVTNAFAIPWNFSSLAHNKKLEKLLVDTIGRPSFSELKKPLAVVASDLSNQQMRVLDRGDVVTAVLATCAIPSVLPPVEVEGALLVDGGMVDNLPIDIAYKMGASDVIAVDLSYVAAYGVEEAVESGSRVDRGLSMVTKYPQLSIMLHAMDVALRQTTDLYLEVHKPEVLIRPYLGTIGMLDFHRLQEGIEAGRMAFLGDSEEIKQKLLAYIPTEEVLYAD